MSASSWPKSSRYDRSAEWMILSSSSVSSTVCTRGSTPGRRLVATADRRAEGDELDALLAGDRHAGRGGIDPDEATRLELDLLAVDAHHASAADDEVDLLLVLLGVVVLVALGPGWQGEVVEPERARAELAAHLAHGAARAFALE